MNFFWSGPRLSYLRYQTLRSFRRLNPSFPVTLWHPSIPCRSKTWNTIEHDDTRCKGPDYSDRVEALGIERRGWTPTRTRLSHTHASDLFRWWLLSHAGGYYCDMDIYWIKPFDAVHARYGSADALLCCEDAGRVFAIGMMGASPDSAIYGDVLRVCLSRIRRSTYESVGVYAVYEAAGVPYEDFGARRLLSRLREQYPGRTIAVAPDETVYPYHCRNYQRLFAGYAAFPASTVGVHWFAGGTVPNQWNRVVTEDNLARRKCALTKLILKAERGLL